MVMDSMEPLQNTLKDYLNHQKQKIKIFCYQKDKNK